MTPRGLAYKLSTFMKSQGLETNTFHYWADGASFTIIDPTTKASCVLAIEKDMSVQVMIHPKVMFSLGNKDERLQIASVQLVRALAERLRRGGIAVSSTGGAE